MESILCNLTWVTLYGQSITVSLKLVGSHWRQFMHRKVKVGKKKSKLFPVFQMKLIIAPHFTLRIFSFRMINYMIT